MNKFLPALKAKIGWFEKNKGRLVIYDTGELVDLDKDFSILSLSPGYYEVERKKGAYPSGEYKGFHKNKWDEEELYIDGILCPSQAVPQMYCRIRKINNTTSPVGCYSRY